MLALLGARDIPLQPVQLQPTVGILHLTTSLHPFTCIAQQRVDAKLGGRTLARLQRRLLLARSRVLDTDYARETSELARTQIIQQAGTAMLAQANQLPQTVLSLLQ